MEIVRLLLPVCMFLSAFFFGYYSGKRKEYEENMQLMDHILRGCSDSTLEEIHREAKKAIESIKGDK